MAPQVGISDTLRFGSSSSFNHGQKSTVQIQLEEERSKRRQQKMPRRMGDILKGNDRF